MALVETDISDSKYPNEQSYTRMEKPYFKILSISNEFSEAYSLLCLPRKASVSGLFRSERTGENTVIAWSINDEGDWNEYDSSCIPMRCRTGLSSTLFATVHFSRRHDVLLIVTSLGLEVFALHSCVCKTVFNKSLPVAKHLATAIKITANQHHFAILHKDGKLEIFDASWTYDVRSTTADEFISDLELELIPRPSLHSVRRKVNPIREEMHDNFINYPSHVIDEITADSIIDVWLPNSNFLAEEELDRCLSILIEKPTIIASMISEGSAEIKMHARWEPLHPHCANFSRPRVYFHLSYRAVPDIIENVTGDICSSNLENCIEHQIKADRNLTKNFILKNLASDQQYYLQVRVTPALYLKKSSQEFGTSIQPVPNLINKTNFAFFRSRFIPEPGENSAIILGTTIPFLLLILSLLTILTVLACNRCYKMKDLDAIHMNQLEFDIKNSNVWSGHFSKVQKAVFGSKRDRGRQVVAVKSLGKRFSAREKRQLLHEALILGKVKNNEFIINIVGYCYDDSSRNLPMLVLEFMAGGSLDNFLRDSITRSVLKKSDLWKICSCISKAGCFLYQKGIIHRDIALRNCLAERNDPRNFGKVKLSDFGLAKIAHDIYQNLDRSIELPICWMAPESLKSARFTTKSDVWSLGVLMWEVFTWGATPYGKCPSSNDTCGFIGLTTEEAQLHVVTGLTLLDLPSPCSVTLPIELNKILKHTWTYEEEDRPHFKYISQKIAKQFLLSQWAEKLDGRANNGCGTNASVELGPLHEVDRGKEPSDSSCNPACMIKLTNPYAINNGEALPLLNSDALECSGTLNNVSDLQTEETSV